MKVIYIYIYTLVDNGAKRIVGVESDSILLGANQGGDEDDD